MKQEQKLSNHQVSWKEDFDELKNSKSLLWCDEHRGNTCKESQMKKMKVSHSRWHFCCELFCIRV